MNTQHLTPLVTPLHKPTRLAALVCVALLGGLLIATLASIELTTDGHPASGMIVLFGYCLVSSGGCAYWAARGSPLKTPR